MYHIELRESFHNLCHFNLDRGALEAIVKAWTTEPWVEIEGRKWNPTEPNSGSSKVPELPLDQLTMGRGWRAAERQGTDVSEPILGAPPRPRAPPHRALPSRAPQVWCSRPYPTPPSRPTHSASSCSSLLADGPAPLYYAWRLAAKRFPERTPGEALMLAERSVQSLLNTRLIVLLAPAASGDGGRGDSGSDPVSVAEQDLQQVLNAPENWARPDHSTAVRMRRA